MSNQQYNNELKSLKEKINNLTNKTVVSLENLGYGEYLTIEILTHQPLQVLEQSLETIFGMIPHAERLKYLIVAEENGFAGKVNQEQIDGSLQDLSLGSVKVQLERNQQQVLETMQKFVEISEALSQLSSMIYENDYPLSLYQKFRKLYEQINSTSSILHQYQSCSQLFLDRKEQLINQQLNFLQKVLMSSHQLGSRKQRDSTDRRERNSHQKNYRNQTEQSEVPSVTFQQGFQQEPNQLQSEISYLKDCVRLNDKQFTVEIQKYNSILAQMQEQIYLYEKEMEKLKYGQESFGEMARSIDRLKEDKYRDQIIIDNMAKKIRHYERSMGFSTMREGESRLRLNTINSIHREEQKQWRSSERNNSGPISRGLRTTGSATRLGIRQTEMKRRNQKYGVPRLYE